MRIKDTDDIFSEMLRVLGEEVKKGGKHLEGFEWELTERQVDQLCGELVPIFRDVMRIKDTNDIFSWDPGLRIGKIFGYKITLA